MNLTPRAGHYAMLIASGYGSIWKNMVSGGLVCFGKFYAISLICIVVLTRFLTIGKLFMNKPGNFMDEFGVPIVGGYIDGDRYAVFDVENIPYSVGLVNRKDNNESIYKVI